MSRLPPKGSSSGDVLLKIKKASPLSNDLLEAMSETSLPVQVTFLRRRYGISQQELAAAISMKQAHYSRLERKDSDHRISTYQKVAHLLRSRLIILPRGAKIVMPYWTVKANKVIKEGLLGVDESAKVMKRLRRKNA